ncbi:MAG: hypothetical protein ISR76_01815 [Planctomycetes bacterium]|nr:hypothetical protein [Planctomycetota bacterium]MBL7007707.1 hypothetical protein [Planctomycetota bacterium]
MSPLHRFGGLLAYLPYGAAALIPALSPARALALAWVVEAARPAPAEPAPTPRAAFLLGHGSAWLLLHLLRPDAELWRGLVLLAAAAASLPAWRRPGRLAGLVPLLLLLPTLLVALLGLGGRQLPPALLSATPWEALASPAREAAPAPAPALELPAGAALSELPLILPVAPTPQPLEDSPLRNRAWTLVALLGLWQLGVALSREPWRGRLRWLGPLLVVAAAGLARPPQELLVRFEDHSGAWLIEVHRGAGDWDPLRGALLPPGGRFGLEVGAEGLVRVSTRGCWAVARPSRESDPPPSPASAWLEVHPLRAPRSGGPAAAAGGAGLLRWWSAGEAPGAGVRWELGEDGRLFRRPL